MKNTSSCLRDHFPIIAALSECNLCANCHGMKTGMNRVDTMTTEKLSSSPLVMGY